MKKIVVLLTIIMLLIPKNIYAINDTAHSSVVMDIDSGRILYQKNSNNEMLIASTTKIMTFLIAITYAGSKLDSKVVVGDEVLKMYGTNMYLNLKEELTLKDLLYGLMLRSGNDASVVIAKYVAGSVSEFVNLMNEKAKEIGMMNTIFKNPHGLDEETKNYSTAYDLALLTRYLYLNYPIYLEYAGEKYYDFASNLKSYSLINRCKILFTYKKITSAKNGYTPHAGKSLVTTASNDNLNLLIVTLDDPDIYQNHEKLYEYFFSKYKNYLLLDKNNFKIPSNTKNTNLFIKKNFTYPLTSTELDNVELKIMIDDENNTYGNVQIFLGDELLDSEIIYKKVEDVNNNSVLKKILEWLKKTFK